MKVTERSVCAGASRATTLYLVLSLALPLSPGCTKRTAEQPIIRFTKIPPSYLGSAENLDLFEGTLSNDKPGERVVLYTLDRGQWWIQPFAKTPFTQVDSNHAWSSFVHLGQEYAALIVPSGYKPALKLTELPATGADVFAKARVTGTTYVPKHIQFAGYSWEAQQLSSLRGGKANPYSPANVWTDEGGFLHLRLARRSDRWECAGVGLTTSLGEGTYSFELRDLSQLDPAAVVTLYTWDPNGHFHREFDVEISRWGRPAYKNAQYVVQPYWQPSNVSRFEVPPGPVEFKMKWVSGRLSFETRQNGHVISEHIATSGVPSPGGETIHMNLYAFGNSPVPVEKGGEVVIEKFRFVP